MFIFGFGGAVLVAPLFIFVLLPCAPYIVILTAASAVVKRRNPFKTAVLGTAMFLLLGYSWLLLMARIFDIASTKWMKCIHRIFYFSSQIFMASTLLFVWIALDWARFEGQPWLLEDTGDTRFTDPVLSSLMPQLPWVLTAAVVLFWLKLLIARIEHYSGTKPSQTDSICSHETSSMICVDCVTPFALMTFWITPPILFLFLSSQERDFPLVYSPIELIPESVPVPSYFEDLGYLIGATLTVVWTAILLYPAIRRSIDSRKHTTTSRGIDG